MRQEQGKSAVAIAVYINKKLHSSTNSDALGALLLLLYRVHKLISSPIQQQPLLQQQQGLTCVCLLPLLQQQAHTLHCQQHSAMLLLLPGCEDAPICKKLSMYGTRLVPQPCTLHTSMALRSHATHRSKPSLFRK